MNYKEEIEYIMDNFAFETVHNFMILSEWEWYISETDGMAIPNIIQLRNTASSLLYRAVNLDCPYLRTGGFIVKIKKTKKGNKKKGNKKLSLSFNPIKTSVVLGN